MFKATVEVSDPGLLDAYAQLLESAPDVANKLVSDAVNKERDRLLAQFRKEPARVAYPFQWKSDKQRRAFFATKGFGAGIPFRRASAPNRMVDRWKLIVVYEPNKLTSILLENDSPAEKYVTGRDQQPGHVLSGWYQSDDLIRRSQKVITDKVESALIRSFYAIEER